MKLRNKNTGEIGEAHWITFREGRTDLCISLHVNGTYEEVHSLAELNEDWEDYKPTEPLIKDGKICKIFRDWCVANGLDNGKFRYYNDGTLRSTVDDGYSIWFVQLALHVRLKDGMEYTLAELCGEEEE